MAQTKHGPSRERRSYPTTSNGTRPDPKLSIAALSPRSALGSYGTRQIQRLVPSRNVQSRCARLVPGQKPLADEPEYQSTKQVLAEVINVTHLVKNLCVCALPEECVSDDDRRPVAG